MVPADLDGLTHSVDPQLSPDGSRVAFVTNTLELSSNRYLNEIWLIDTTPGATPVRLCEEGDNVSQPRWSNGGDKIAFVRRHEPDEQKDEQKQTSFTLQLRDLSSSQTLTITASEEPFQHVSFAPGDEKLAFSMRTRHDDYRETDPSRREPRKIESLRFMLNGEGFTFDRPEHVYVVAAAEGATPVDLTPGTESVSGPKWFPTGARLAVTLDSHGTTLSTDVAVVDVESSELRVATDGFGIYNAADVSPDGSKILIVGYEDAQTLFENAKVGTIESDFVDGSASPHWLSEALDRTFDPFAANNPPVWKSTGIVAAAEDRGNVHLYRLATGSPARLVVAGERTVTGYSTTDSQPGAIAFTATTPTATSEVFFVDTEGNEHQLTQLGEAWTSRVEPVTPEYLPVPSDGLEVDAWLMRPAGFEPGTRYPMLLNIHGGPFTQYGNLFFDEFQMQAKAGYVVLYCNPRGSSGRDSSWGAAIRGPQHAAPGEGWGSVDFDDVMAVVEAAIDTYDFIDTERLGVLGGSYGGYLTSWIAIHSNRFAAACSERAVNNLLSLEFASDYAGMFSAEIGPTHIENPDEYLRMSPITYVEDLQTPLLIIHSENDLRCPVDQATQMFVACKLLDKEVEYWLFPDEDHELSRSGSPIHRQRRAEIILEFFDRKL